MPNIEFTNVDISSFTLYYPIVLKEDEDGHYTWQEIGVRDSRDKAVEPGFFRLRSIFIAEWDSEPVFRI